MKNIIKKYRKEVLMNSIIGSILSTVIVYVIIGPYNTEFVDILQGIATDGSAVEVSLVMFPIILILCLMINLGRIVVKEK